MKAFATLRVRRWHTNDQQRKSDKIVFVWNVEVQRHNGGLKVFMQLNCFILKVHWSYILYLCSLVCGIRLSSWHKGSFLYSKRPFLSVRRGRASGHLLFLLMSTLPVLHPLFGFKKINQGFVWGDQEGGCFKECKHSGIILFQLFNRSCSAF